MDQKVDYQGFHSSVFQTVKMDTIKEGCNIAFADEKGQIPQDMTARVDESGNLFCECSASSPLVKGLTIDGYPITFASQNCPGVKGACPILNDGTTKSINMSDNNNECWNQLVVHSNCVLKKMSKNVHWSQGGL